MMMQSYRIVRKVDETSNVTSIYLTTEDGTTLKPFRGGQRLVVDIPGLGERSYLLSAFSSAPRTYRITVAHDAGPTAVAETAEAYWQHQVMQGDVIRARGPTGHFHLPGRLDRPIACFVSGTGESFMAAVAEELAVRSPDHPILFFYSTVNSNTFGLRTKVESLRSELKKSRWAVWYSQPLPGDREGKDYHFGGAMDFLRCRPFFPAQECDVLVCGPDEFVSWAEEELRTGRIPAKSILSERLGRARCPKAAREEPLDEPRPARYVHFKRSGITAVWTWEQGSLLDLAQAVGLEVPYSCRTGICGTCAQRIPAGTVVAVRKTYAKTSDDNQLLCSSIPITDIEIDF